MLLKYCFPLKHFDALAVARIIQLKLMHVRMNTYLITYLFGYLNLSAAHVTCYTVEILLTLHEIA